MAGGGGGDHKRRALPTGGGGGGGSGGVAAKRRRTATATSFHPTAAGRPATGTSGVFVICGRCGKANHIRCAYCKACFLSKVDMGAAAAAAAASTAASGGRRGAKDGGAPKTDGARAPAATRGPTAPPARDWPAPSRPSPPCDRPAPARPSPPLAWAPPCGEVAAAPSSWVPPPPRSSSPVWVPPPSRPLLACKAEPWQPSTPPRWGPSSRLAPPPPALPPFDRGAAAGDPMMLSSSPVLSACTAWSPPVTRTHGAVPPLPPASPPSAHSLGLSSWGWSLRFAAELPIGGPPVKQEELARHLASQDPPIKEEAWWAPTQTAGGVATAAVDAGLSAPAAAAATAAAVAAGRPAGDAVGAAGVPPPGAGWTAPRVPATAPSAGAAAVPVPSTAVSPGTATALATAGSEVAPDEAAMFASFVDALADAVPADRVGDAVGGSGGGGGGGGGSSSSSLWGRGGTARCGC
ncbi:hypothetical protein I4F81_000604 [Pyropia yezoensis]|uniref:Uncharacterized protein n=1 Tax=Pyropia yezoensis TaxID=2788 RepID=A0ACC3BJR3_PYRYE|nr:hypothetical protein I4F81_000604 [Neopyropia yezoensis]